MILKNKFYFLIFLFFNFYIKSFNAERASLIDTPFLKIDFEFLEALSNPFNRELFNEWSYKNNRQYTSDNFLKRFGNFIGNLLYVNKYNRNGISTESSSMKLGLNKMSDLSFEEYQQHYLSTLDPSKLTDQLFSEHREDINIHGSGGLLSGILSGTGRTILSNNNTSLRPESFDWRTKGLVSSIKSQGACGCCSAFSSIAVLEYLYFKQYNQSLDFSEQEIVDCTNSPVYGNLGCKGGWMHTNFLYVNKSGIGIEADYPFEEKDGSCRNTKRRKYLSVTKYVMVPQNDEETLTDVVAYISPVAVAFDATTREFMNYESGIFDSQSCEKSRTTHAATVVGYGVEKGVPFWILKNSWGNDWGEGGYFRMRRNTGNRCGIATAASYPYITR